MPFFKAGTAEQLFLFLRNVEKVIIGQHANDPASRYALMRRLLQGDALAFFNSSIIKRVEENAENFLLSSNDLIMHVLPVRALAEQKRYM